MSKKVFIFSLFAALLALPTYAFKVHFTLAGEVLGIGKPIHEEITEAAIGSIEGFKVFFKTKDGSIKFAEINEDFLTLLKEENTENDEVGLYDGTLHFDDSRINESSYHAYTLTDAAVKAIKDGSGADDCYFCDGNPVAANLGAATHTAQDFFAHSTWVETNVGLGSFSGENKVYLNPLSDHIPIPKIGLVKNPLSVDSFTSTHDHPNDVEVRNDSPRTTTHDDVDGHCTDSGYNAIGNKQITTAYYDFRMSALPLWPESGPLQDSKPSSWKTDVWSGYYPAIAPAPDSLRYPDSDKYKIDFEKINWPKKRCIHGDELVGINKDSPVASGAKANTGNYERAYNAAAMATRNLVMHFINQSNVLIDETISEEVQKKYFNIFKGKLPEITHPILIPDLKYTDGSPVENKSGGEVYGFNFKVNLFSVPANMLDVNFGENSCEMIDGSISKNFKGNKTHYFVCYQNNPGALTIFQKSNETLALYHADDFPFDRVSMSWDWLVGQSVSIVINKALHVFRGLRSGVPKAGRARLLYRAVGCCVSTQRRRGRGGVFLGRSPCVDVAKSAAVTKNPPSY